MAYASRRVPEISDTLEDVDHAMEWGFVHQTGPSRTWDLLGVRRDVERMEAMGIEVAQWVREMLEAATRASTRRRGQGAPAQPGEMDYEPVREDPMSHLARPPAREGKEISRNDSASLLDLGDGVLCLEFHAKGNSIDVAVVEMGNGR